MIGYLIPIDYPRLAAERAFKSKSETADTAVSPEYLID